MKRSTAIGLMATAQVLAVSSAVRSQALAVVRVGASPSDSSTALLYAIQSGIFRRHGLDVQVQPAVSGAAVAAAVVGGAVDVATSSLMSLISSYTRGVHFKIVAGGVSYSAGESYFELSVLKSSGIMRPADANNKTAATSALRSLEALGTQLLIDQDGGNSTTVKFIELPPAAMLAMLDRGSADLVAIYEPFLEQALETRRIRTLGSPYGGIGKRLVISAWFCSQDYLARNAAVAQRFNDAMRESALYTNAHHADTVSMLSAYTHVEADVIQRMMRMNAATSVEPADIQPAIDAAAKYKYIDRPFPAQELLP